MTLVPWPRFVPTHHLQMLAYAHALSLMAGRTYWLAFIDLDEFLFPSRCDSMAQALAEFADEPAVAAYWTLFGTSGHRARPAGLVIDNYTWRAPYPREPETVRRRPGRTQPAFAAHCKSIVQPHRVLGTIDPHCFRTDRFPILAVDGSWNEILPGRPRKVASERFQLNHYFSKSLEEFKARRSRTNIRGNEILDKKSQRLAEIECSPIEDYAILRFSERVKEALERHRQESIDIMRNHAPRWSEEMA